MTSFRDDHINRLVAAVQADGHEAELLDDRVNLRLLFGNEIKAVSLTNKQLREGPTPYLIVAIQSSPVVDHVD